jgi:hypothetical protein
MKTPFPSVRDLAANLIFTKVELRNYPRGEVEEIEVRLQVTEEGWWLWTGDPQYDTDHRGWWGSGVITRTTNCAELAKELLAEARCDQSMCGS